MGNVTFMESVFVIKVNRNKMLKLMCKDRNNDEFATKDILKKSVKRKNRHGWVVIGNHLHINNFENQILFPTQKSAGI